jgi:hypothetical protein
MLFVAHCGVGESGIEQLASPLQKSDTVRRKDRFVEEDLAKLRRLEHAFGQDNTISDIIFEVIVSEITRLNACPDYVSVSLVIRIEQFERRA